MESKRRVQACALQGVWGNQQAMVKVVGVVGSHYLPASLVTDFFFWKLRRSWIYDFVFYDGAGLVNVCL